MVNRCYVAIEGEEQQSAKQMVFQDTGCSVGCKWCDSRQTWRFDLELNDWRQNSHFMFKIEQNELEEFVEHLSTRTNHQAHFLNGWRTTTTELRNHPRIHRNTAQTSIYHTGRNIRQLCDKQTMKYLGKIAEAGGIIRLLNQHLWRDPI